MVPWACNRRMAILTLHFLYRIRCLLGIPTHRDALLVLRSISDGMVDRPLVAATGYSMDTPRTRLDPGSVATPSIDPRAGVGGTQQSSVGRLGVVLDIAGSSMCSVSNGRSGVGNTASGAYWELRESLTECGLTSA